MNTYYVVTSYESADGSSGWGSEAYGPYARDEAEEVAKRHPDRQAEGANGAKVLVEILSDAEVAERDLEVVGRHEDHGYRLLSDSQLAELTETA